jgi:surface polysaccharide O-acyltransferase-like enzyme
MKKRNSSIELLKIIAIILIILSHCVKSVEYIDNLDYAIGIASNNGIFLILNILMCSGNIGNVIFVICSAYFLLDSNKTKKEKIFNMILDTFTISMLWLIPFIFLHIDVSTKVLIKQFAPITFQNNWFVCCYILLYIIHPLLNIIIKKCSQKELLRICLTMFILYSCIQFILKGKYYFNELVGFIYIYFIISYIKLYMKQFTNNKKLNITLLIVSNIGNLLLILLTNYLGLYLLSNSWQNFCP